MPKKGTRKPPKVIGDPNDPDGLAVWLRRYLLALAVKNYSPETVEHRERELGHFIEWALDQSINRPTEVTKAIIEGFQRHLFYARKKNGKPLAFRTQHTRLIPVRSFFKWLTRSNVIPFNPASEVELPRLERRLPKCVLTESDIEKVMMQADLEDPLGVRDRAILETLYSTGIRRAEAVNLRLTDLDAERGTLLVRLGKGKKDWMLPIGERAVHWIAKYLDQVRPGLVVPPDEGVLFLTSTGESFSRRRLTQLVAGYIAAADLGKHGACHLIRHSMATLMLEGGADIRHVQEMLGHVLISTTELYLHVSIRQLKLVHEATHPGARLAHRPVDPEAVAQEEKATADDLLADLAAEEAEDPEDGP